MKIYKYEISMNVTTTTIMLGVPPVKVCHFAIQAGIATVWIQVDDNHHERTIKNSELEFRIVGTGQAMAVAFEHVATTIDGMYVWHLLQRRRTAYIA